MSYCPSPLSLTANEAAVRISRLQFRFSMLICLTSLLAVSSAAKAQTLNTLYDFQSATDAVVVNTPLIFDAARNLYGASAYGGTSVCLYGNGCGTVFELSPPAIAGDPWTETILYSFQGNGDGWAPGGTLVIDNKGNLYGTTQSGGLSQTACQGLGCGLLYMLTPPSAQGGTWTRRVLHVFTGGTDGGVPSGLVLGSGDVLYGTTTKGGAYGLGTAYSIQLGGGKFTQTVLYSFGAFSGDAFYPQAPILDASNNLYGASSGGWYEKGCIFMLVAPSAPGGQWKESLLHSSSTGSITGDWPTQSMAIDRNGDVWGVMSGGGPSGYGTIYELQMPSVKGGKWHYRDVHNFRTGEGSNGLILDRSNNTFYGSSFYNESFFQLTPPSVAGGSWNYSTVYTLLVDQSQGFDPFQTPALGSDGNLYGSTVQGGAYGWGTIYQLTP